MIAEKCEAVFGRPIMLQFKESITFMIWIINVVASGGLITWGRRSAAKKAGTIRLRRTGCDWTWRAENGRHLS